MGDPAPTPPAYSYRGLSRTARIPPCAISMADLKKLHGDLAKKSEEALERYLATLPRPPGQSPEQFEALKHHARTIGGVTVGVFGIRGEQLLSSTQDVFDTGDLPDRIGLITFDSAAGLQTQNVQLPNRFLVRLDFSEPPAFVRYDPNNQPTPNGSQLEVSGPDDTWVTAVYESAFQFFRTRRRNRGWLHSEVTFNVLQWLVAIPLALWFAYRLDAKLASALPGIHTALRGAFDVYVLLLGLLFFRAVMYGFRWIFPVIELEGATSKTARRLLGAGLSSLLLALLYDILKAVFT